MGQPGKKTAVPRTRRRDNGMARTAGVSAVPARDRLTRTLQLVRAALRAWEARHEHSQAPRVWRKQPVEQGEITPQLQRPRAR
jgi:hypothetical protein